jgi:hypothetical protein
MCELAACNVIFDFVLASRNNWYGKRRVSDGGKSNEQSPTD